MRSSSCAKCCPMQLRGPERSIRRDTRHNIIMRLMLPALKGMKAKGSLFAHASLLNRSGSNRSGSGQNSGSLNSNVKRECR